jgi:N-acetylneuraminic acid mutarotase
MRKKQFSAISIMVIIIFCTTTSTSIKNMSAQVLDSWTWISGSNDINQLGVYGVKGVENPSNKPGGRYAYASWIDNDGNFWIFGGMGYNNDTTIGYLNDLWRYNITSQNWAWMAGSPLINQVGNQGTRGIFDINNQPAGRTHCSYFICNDGHLWIFGGATQSAKRADLWCYNVTIESWAWIAGNDTDDYLGNFGTYRTFDPSHHPPARAGCAAWVQTRYNLFFIFGGYAPTSEYMNDLWAYSPYLDEWAWVSGSNLTNQNGVYGSIGVEDPSYCPGARSAMAGWISDDDYMWIFGGYGRDSVGSEFYLNDLWRYNSSSDGWTWMSGSSFVNQVGIYGTKGLYDAANTPGARSAPAYCKDSYDNLMLFGGTGGIGTRFNDLWQYNQSRNEWRWISGNSTSNAISIYGTQGVTDLSSYPGARDRTSIQCDSNGEIWMFGGYGYDDDTTVGYLNDLWKYVPLDLVIITEFRKLSLISVTLSISILMVPILTKRKRK